MNLYSYTLSDDNTMEVINLFNNPVLFTTKRIKPSAIPNGYFRYEVRGDFQNNFEPYEISRGPILSNFLGTIISNKPIQFPIIKKVNKTNLLLNENDWKFTNTDAFINEYLLDYPINMIPLNSSKLNRKAV